MRIVISGGSGLVGTALSTHLSQAGNEVTFLSRGEANASAARSVAWNPYAGPKDLPCDPRLLDGEEAFLHLSGANVAEGRWTPARKQLLRDSRVISTHNLVRLLAQVKPSPRVLLCASAIGYYGDRGEEMLTEESAAGSGFLPELCKEWEQAAQEASDLGMRVVHLRFSVVLSAQGGALKKMLLPFRLGLGGRLGDGKQYISWIAMQDAVQAIAYALRTETLQGALNITAPNPVTNLEFTKTLGRALHRPTIFPAPAFALRALLGELSEALLSSSRVLPRQLLEAQFQFRYPDLPTAFASLLQPSPVR